MREILFRGKHKTNGAWVYGFYVHCADRWGRDKDLIQSIDPESGEFGLLHDIDPETVGQFTGLTDKNGKKIFEGDIVKQTFEKTSVIIASDWDCDRYGDLYGEDFGAVVIIPSKGACIKNPIIHREVNGEITQHDEKAKMYKNICSGRCEIIGNIHDNPELLEAQS